MLSVSHESLTPANDLRPRETLVLETAIPQRISLVKFVNLSKYSIESTKLPIGW